MSKCFEKNPLYQFSLENCIGSSSQLVWGRKLNCIWNRESDACCNFKIYNSYHIEIWIQQWHSMRIWFKTIFFWCVCVCDVWFPLNTFSITLPFAVFLMHSNYFTVFCFEFVLFLFSITFYCLRCWLREICAFRQVSLMNKSCFFYSANERNNLFFVTKKSGLIIIVLLRVRFLKEKKRQNEH